jgi:hypothetical protein
VHNTTKGKEEMTKVTEAKLNIAVFLKKSNKLHAGTDLYNLDHFMGNYCFSSH